MKFAYKTVTFRIEHDLDKENAKPFSISTYNSSLDPEAEKQLEKLGVEGWELVSVVPVWKGGAATGMTSSIAFFKKSLE